MKDFESVDEILDFAIGREIEAIRLYIDLAKKVEKPEMQRVLKGFAMEEQEHRIKLEDAKAIGFVLKEEEVGNLGIADEKDGHRKARLSGRCFAALSASRSAKPVLACAVLSSPRHY